MTITAPSVAPADAGERRPALSHRLQALKPSPTIAMEARAKALASAGANVLALTLGEPDFDTPPHIKAAAERAIRDGKTKYTPAGGIPELRQAIVRKFARDNSVEYEPAEVVACVGGKQALYNVMLALCDPGDEVLIPVPNWPTFADQVSLVDGVPVLVPLPPDKRLRAQDLEAYFTPRTRAVIVNSPSNPTGAVMRPADVRAVAELAIERGVYVVSDETYEHFLYDGATHVAPASLGPEAKQWTIEVNTVSKSYAMTGWRIGYVAGPREVVKAVDTLMSQTTSNPTSVAQWAAVEALTGPQECVQEMVAEFAKRRALLVDGLCAIGFDCVRPQGAFYAYPRIPAAPDGGPGDSTAFATALAERAHVVTVPGSAFFDEGYLRMSYAASTAVLEQVLERLRCFHR